MYKKLLVTALLVCSVPVMANAAWQLNTWAKSGGGHIDSQNMTGQTSVAGSIFKTYTASTGSQTISVTPDQGYTISSVILNGNTANTLGTYYINEGSGDKSLFATFKPSTVVVTAGVGDGGSVTPTSIKSIYYGTKVITPITFRFIPKAGYFVSAITGAAGFTVSSALPAAVGTTVTVTIPKDAVITTPIALSGTFATTALIANAGPSKTVVAGSVTLNGNVLPSPPAFSKWSSVSVPVGAGKIQTVYTPDLTFTAVPGDYQFKYRVANTGDQSWATMALRVVNPLKDAANQCTPCHNGNNVGGVGQAAKVYANWSASSYKAAGVWCATCHSGADTGGHPGTLAGAVANHKAKGLACTMCHAGAQVINGDAHKVDSIPATLALGKCAACHNGTALPAAGHHFGSNTNSAADLVGCVDCHSVGQNANASTASFVNDNSGVRAVTGGFTKWSHHVTGVTLQDAHCAACHLEGKAVNGTIVVDTTYHMVDAKTHLRNADDDTDFAWDPATPNHGNMDNFCMSCHDSDGATSRGSIAIRAVLGVFSTASNTHAKLALNPFNDTISNQYDKMMRGRVVDVDSQFTTTNASHHAVKGKKYSGRDKLAGDPRSIASPATFEANKDLAVFANTSSTHDEFAGSRETIYEAGRFVSTYQTLTGANGTSDKSLGDDSTLHCGDCHTVGQWKAGSSVNVDGTPTVAVIGAHGSANEYMLRVSNGADALHRGAQYSYNPANMLGGRTPVNLGYTSGLPAAIDTATGLPLAKGVAGDFAGIQFGPYPTGKPYVATLKIADQAVPATEVPELQPFLVCYNCHVYTEYGSIYFSNTAQGGREGSHAYGDHTRGNYCNGPYNTSGSGRATTYTAVYGQQVTDSVPNGTFMGVANFNIGRLQPGVASTYVNGETTVNAAAVWCSATVANNLELKTNGTGFNKLYDLTTGLVATADGTCDGGSTLSTNAASQLAFQGMNGSNAGGSNIFQIQCANCHNAGPANGFGGIHGSKIDTYVDAAGQNSKPRRFLPGLGNVRWVPGDKRATEAQQWEQEANIPSALGGPTGTNQAGCYTLTTSAGAPGQNRPLPAASEGGTTTGNGQLFGTWGSCTDHSSVDGLERTMIRPVSY